jgi:hypothetical protein
MYSFIQKQTSCSATVALCAPYGVSASTGKSAATATAATIHNGTMMLFWLASNSLWTIPNLSSGITASLRRNI